MLQEMGNSHDDKRFAIGSFLECLAVWIANDYFSSKHLTRLSNQCKTDWFLLKFALKIPTKLASFYQLFCSEVSPENFRESVSENPVKFDISVTGCLQISQSEVGINLEVKWLCLCDLAHFLWWKQSEIRWNVRFIFTLLI